MLGVAIPTWRRAAWTLEAVSDVLGDPRVAEVTVVDDGSGPETKDALASLFAGQSKARLFFKHDNVGCYFNKRRAVFESALEWVVLLDSDNRVGKNYLDAIGPAPHDPDVLYAPSFAMPAFDYRAYEGLEVTRANLHAYVDAPRFLTALNTGNFFVNRRAYLEVFDQTSQPYAVDSLYFAYCWLASGRRILFVPGMHYKHRVHGGSNYVAMAPRTADFAAALDKKVRELR